MDISTHKQACGEPDSNRRTPTGMDPKSITFDLARKSPQWYTVFMVSILKKFKIDIVEKEYNSARDAIGRNFA